VLAVNEVFKYVMADIFIKVVPGPKQRSSLQLYR